MCLYQIRTNLYHVSFCVAAREAKVGCDCRYGSQDRLLGGGAKMDTYRVRSDTHRVRSNGSKQVFIR